MDQTGRRTMANPHHATHDRPSPFDTLPPDDQISDLELSVTVSAAEEAAEDDEFTWSPLANATTSHGHRDQPRTLQAVRDSKAKYVESSTASPQDLPSPYDGPEYTNHWSFHHTPTNPFRRRQPVPKPEEQYASVKLPNLAGAWEDDAVTIDRRKVPRHPNESQQDLAERINALTRQIQNHTQFCVEVSKQALALANENKHVIPKVSSSVSETLSTYVVKPALDLPGKLRTYYPALSGGIYALKGYEENIRQLLVNSANARDMVVAQGAGVGASRSDIGRLKDRLIEQDSMLKDSSSHLTRLIKERDALKRKLEEWKGSPGTGSLPDTPSLMDVAEHHGQSPNTDGASPDTGTRRRGTGEGHRDSQNLGDQLRELRLLVDELSLQQVSQHDGHDSSGEDEDHAGVGDREGEEDPEWTLL